MAQRTPESFSATDLQKVWFINVTCVEFMKLFLICILEMKANNYYAKQFANFVVEGK